MMIDHDQTAPFISDSVHEKTVFVDHLPKDRQPNYYQ